GVRTSRSTWIPQAHIDSGADAAEPGTPTPTRLHGTCTLGWPRGLMGSPSEIGRLIVAVVPALVEVQVWGIDGMWRRCCSRRFGQGVVGFVVLVVVTDVCVTT